MNDWHRQLRPQDRVRLRSGKLGTITGRMSDGVLLGYENGTFRALRWNKFGCAHPDDYPHDDDIVEKVT